MTYITAHVQLRQQHICSVQAASSQGYYGGVQPEQRIIANWIERTRERLGWSYAEWADRAGIGAATTITRAIKDDYASVTSIKTLHALARAAGERSVLDALEAKPEDQAPAQSLPSADTIAALLAAVLPLARGHSDRSLRVVAAALQHGLELLGDQPTTPDDAALGVAARAAVSRFRDLTRQ